MKRLLRSMAAVTAVVMLMASCGKSAEDDSSEIDITAEIFSSQAETTAAVESQPQESEEESSQEEEESSEEEEAEESSQEEEAEDSEEESEEEPEESEAEEVEPEPEEDTDSGNITIFKGLGYTIQTDDALWLNEQDKMEQMQEDVAKQAEEMGIDAQMQDSNGNNIFDAVYSYVPDSDQPYISNFNITAYYLGTNNVDLSGMKGQYDEYYNAMPEFDLVSSENSSFNGKNALKFVLTTSVAGIDLKMVSYMFAANNYLYNVNLASTAERFDMVSADFDKVIATFTFG